MDLNSILNIRSVDYKDDIYEIVSDEMNNLNAQVDDVSGFCKYIANNIEVRLKELGIKTYNIDLNDIGVDHVFLICEYRNKKMMRFLIDPTFEQFTRRDNKLLVKANTVKEEVSNTIKSDIKELKVYIVFAVFIILVSILAISSISTVSLLLRKRDYGIMYANGMSMQDVRKIVITENILILREIIKTILRIEI